MRALSLLFMGLVCSLCIACSLLADLAPTKEKVVNVKDWLAVPIFYATNRLRATSQQIDFVEKKNNNIWLFGVKNVIVPCPGDLAAIVIERMGWRLIHLNQAVPSNESPRLSNQKYKVPDKEFLLGEIISNFDKYRSMTNSEETVLFVHGCCATFKTNMQRAAKLAAQMRTPIIVYDWVSPTGFTHYLENETLVQQTYDDFCNFLDSLAKYLHTDKTILIGHSMGAAFVDEAFVRRFQRSYGGKPLSKYKEIILSQPDIDARAYLNHNNNIVDQAYRTRIFMVLDDPRLQASAIAHGGYERLGRPESLLNKLWQVNKQDIVDMTASGIGHNLPVNFIGDMYRNGTIDNSEYKLVQKSARLFILEKKHDTLSDHNFPF